MVTAWSQPDRVVRVRSTASAPLNHTLMVIIPLVLINSRDPHCTFNITTFISSAVVCLWQKHTPFPHTHTHSILPSISYFYFRFSVLPSVQHAAASLDCTVLKHTLTRAARIRRRSWQMQFLSNPTSLFSVFLPSFLYTLFRFPH